MKCEGVQSTEHLIKYQTFALCSTIYELQFLQFTGCSIFILSFTQEIITLKKYLAKALYIYLKNKWKIDILSIILQT